MISVRGVGKSYGPRQALSDISFEVARGGCLVVRGGQGSGRTTLLNVLGTLVRQSSGTVVIDGLDTVTDVFAVRRRIGFVSRPWPAGDRVRADEYVRCFAGDRVAEAGHVPETTIPKALKRAGLEAATLVDSLPTGQRAVLALTAALVAPPPALLLDDPFCFIDDVRRESFVEWLGEVREAGTTIVIGVGDDAGPMPPGGDVVSLSAGRMVRERS